MPQDGFVPSQLKSATAEADGATSDAAQAKKPLLAPPSSVQQLSAIQRVVGAALDTADSILDYLNAEKEENQFLSGNFAPVLERANVDTELKIDGEVPPYVRGEFVRVGPNPKYKPRAGYHWFDGDGMIHGVSFSGGNVCYVNRFVKTKRLETEDARGKPMFPKIGDLKGASGLLRLLLFHARGSWGLVDARNAGGTANTALVFHGGALLALNEGDAPYAVKVLRDGELETLGRLDYAGQLDHSFTAHPKLDPVTGELFAFGYDVEKAPYVTYRVVTASGGLGPKVPITLPSPVMMHDFAITEKHAIFMDLPLEFDPKVMVSQNSLPFVWKDRAARFGVLPRNDTSEANMRWFTLPPLMVFHTANAWEDEEKGEVVLLACRMDKVTLQFTTDSVDQGKLTEFRFNLKSGTATERTLSDVKCDFPRINEAFTGRKSRYVYAAVFQGISDIVGVVKFDLSKEPKLLTSAFSSAVELAEAESQAGGCVAGFASFGPGRFGSEPVFVARDGVSPLAAEDDGCLLNMVYDSAKNLSEVVILDAKTMSLKPLAVVHLNSRVPFGFHGTFVTEEQLQQQK